MMKKIFKYTLYLSFFISSLFYFFPKENLYFYLEKNLAEKKVIISKEKIKEKPFSLSLKDSTIYYNNLELLNVKDIDITTYLLSNSVNLKKIKILEEFKNFVPQNIDYIDINHSIINPVIININSKGEFGKLIGKVDLIDRKVIISLTASNKMKSKYQKILRKMQLKEGEYKYEYKF